MLPFLPRLVLLFNIIFFAPLQLIACKCLDRCFLWRTFCHLDSFVVLFCLGTVLASSTQRCFITVFSGVPKAMLDSLVLDVPLLSLDCLLNYIQS